MIAKNEAERIGAAFDSVEPVADEIILVDTGSTDRTAALASARGAKVLHRKWDDDFSGPRNAAIDQANARWILMLDADERLSPGQENRLRKHLSANVDGWTVRIRSVLGEETGGQLYEHAFPRLFRNDPRFRFRGRVHEQIVDSILEVGGALRDSSIIIDHAGYALSAEERRGKLLRNRRLLLFDLDDRPSDRLAWYHLGETHALLGEDEAACAAYRRAVDGRNLPPEHAAFAHQNLGAALVRRGRFSEAVAETTAALRIDDRALTARLIRASALLRLNRPDDALADIDTYLRNGKRSSLRPGGLHLGIDEGKARLLRGECLLRAGRPAEALRDALAASAVRDAWIAPFRLAARAALAAGDRPAARDALGKLCALTPDEPAAWIELARVVFALDGPSAALAVLDEALRFGAPRRSAEVHGLIGALRIRLGDRPGALDAYTEARRLDPTRQEYSSVVEHLCRETGKNGKEGEGLSKNRLIEEESDHSSHSARRERESDVPS